MSRPRLVAFYLPQFHPTPENDAWWGQGFTEWTNVTKARPLFEGHYQPHLPTDFGFYDLRLRQTRRDQIRVARQFGVDAFCYHYYWFSGRRLLFEPLDDMLADPQSDMPFCLCWANESWTRKWDGAEQQTLIAQDYRPQDDLGFIQSVMPFLSDPRYLKIDGAPLLIVYRPQSLPDPRNTLRVWREYCRSQGMAQIHLCAARIRGNTQYAELGFDSGVEFPPHNLTNGSVNHQINFTEPFHGNVMHYDEIARSFLGRAQADRNVFMTVFPSWDNTARLQNRALIVIDACPDNYERWLAESLRVTEKQFPGQERLVFINAWNEWAEGCHLEPDHVHGRGFLEATLRAKSGRSTRADFVRLELPERSRGLGEDVSNLCRYHAARSVSLMRRWGNRHPRIKKALRRLLKAARLWPSY